MVQDVHAKLNPGLSWQKVAFNKKKAFFTNRLDLNLRRGKKPVKCYILSIALYCAVTWTPRKVDQKYLGCFEMWCWRRMEKIIWTDRVRNLVLRRVKGERNILQSIKRKKANWSGHILFRNCLLKHVIEGKVEGTIEVTGRRGRRRKRLLDDLTKRDDTGY